MKKKNEEMLPMETWTERKDTHTKGYPRDNVRCSKKECTSAPDRKR
jgi:hypothetical protein